MTNLSPIPTELQALEAELELYNRISLRQRLDLLLKDPDSTIDEIKQLVALLSQMVRDYSTHIKALTRERELALAERRLDVRQEAMALQRAKMERAEQIADAASQKKDSNERTEVVEKPHPKTASVPSSEIAVPQKDVSPAVTVPATCEKPTRYGDPAFARVAA